MHDIRLVYRAPVVLMFVAAFGLFQAAPSKAQTLSSSWGVHVGYDESDNVYVFCSPKIIVPPSLSPSGRSYVRSYFRRVRSDGTATADIVTTAAANRTRLRCFDNANFSGTPSIVTGGASMDTSDSSLATCPADKPHGNFAECRIEFSGTWPETAGYDAPFVYHRTACGNGISSMSSQLFGQETGSASTQQVTDAQQQGPLLQVNDTVAQAGIYGTDLGYPFFSNFRMYYAFGDTNGASRQIAHNTLASSSYTGGYGIVPFTGWFGVSGSDRLADPFIRNLGTDGAGAIPSGGFSITEGGHNYKYVWQMSVAAWDPVLRVNSGSLAFSKDDGAFERLDDPLRANMKWSSSSNFTNVGTYHQLVGTGAGYIYIYGFKADGNMPNSTSGVRLMRVRATHASISNKAQYEYWDGSRWNVNDEASAIEVVPGSHRVRELSVAFNSYANRYMMMFEYADGLNSHIELMQSATLTGPWTTVGTLPHHILNYAPMIHDRMMAGQGATVVYFLSDWGAYNVGQWIGSVSRRTLTGCN